MSSPLLSGKRIIVTGASGFIGSAVVRRAVGDGAHVTAIVRGDSDLWRLSPVRAEVTVSHCAIDSLGDFDAMIGPVDAVVHCAAAGVNQAFDNVEEMVATNVRGTVAALRFAARLAARRFVMIGTSGEYGPGQLHDEDGPLTPNSEYGATRAGATLIARAFGARRKLDVVVVRPFAVYGPYEAAYRLVPHAVLHALRGETISISSGMQTRDYVHVDDVADGVLRAAVRPEASGSVFNLCTGIDTRVRDAVEQITRLAGRGSSVEAGAVPTMRGEMWKTSGNPARARAQLGWIASRDLERGLVETIDWFRATGLGLPQYSDTPPDPLRLKRR